MYSLLIASNLALIFSFTFFIELIDISLERNELILYKKELSIGLS